MNIFIMRHGRTVWNEKGICQGRSNNRLSREGKVLTEKVAEEFKNQKIDVIYASPLMRTMQTANIMNKHHNVKIIKDDLLIEIDQGIFSGRGKDSFNEEEKELRRIRSPKAGIESYQSVGQRCKKFIESVLENCPYENVLVITHNVGASLLELILKGIEIDYNNPDHIRSFDNAKIKKVEIK